MFSAHAAIADRSGNLTWISLSVGAGGGNRTRGIQLGKFCWRRVEFALRYDRSLEDVDGYLRKRRAERIILASKPPQADQSDAPGEAPSVGQEPAPHPVSALAIAAKQYVGQYEDPRQISRICRLATTTHPPDSGRPAG
jgi:hypothetical protein